MTLWSTFIFVSMRIQVLCSDVGNLVAVESHPGILSLCADNEGLRETFFSKVLQETALGQILVKYARENLDSMFAAYLHDYVHMMYKPAGVNEAEQTLEYQVCTRIVASR